MKTKITILVLFSFFSILTYSQKRLEKKADNNYNEFAYVDAIKTYERMFEKGYKNPDMLEKLGNAYYFNANLPKAAEWYGELFKLNQTVDPEYYYRYAQSLKSIKEYQKADEMMAKFSEANKNDLRAKLAINQKDYLEKIKENSGKYTVKNVAINSENSDYGCSFYKNNLVFTSARDINGKKLEKHVWTGENYTNLFLAKIAADGSLENPVSFSDDLISKYNESTPVFSKDGKTVYFTRNKPLSKKQKGSGLLLLKIYKATFDGNHWTNISELPFENNEFNVSHPALSQDEKTLYFASNMTGTLGQSDIFKVAINTDGTYGTPINLGNKINTEGRETFPSITSDNELYFASDGYPGLGGLDIFEATIDSNGNYDNVTNIGEPINSPNDDFSFIINKTTNIGYFTSNRNGGKGEDDIYMFKIAEVPKPRLIGAVTDLQTGKKLANSQVILSDQNHNELKEMVTDQEGKFNFGDVEYNTKYYIKASKNEYDTNEKSLISDAKNKENFIEIGLDKTVCKVAVGDDLAKCFKIKEIYFDLDKSAIREDASLELAKILDVLEQNPNLELVINSHTDSRASSEYNLKLSQQRAQSTFGWLVAHKVDKSRLSYKGFGETKLVNGCSDNVQCTEEQHQANRRSEFIVTKI